MQSPFNPITRPITSRRKRNTSSAVASEPNDKYESIDMQYNETNGGLYEKYVIEAVEIDKGNDTAGKDSEYHEESNEDDDRVYTAADYRISKPNDFSTARWSLFKGIEMLAERSVVVLIYKFCSLKDNIYLGMV